MTEGSHVLTTHKDGFQTTSSYVTVTEGQTTLADFSLTSVELSTIDMWVDGINFSLGGNSLSTEVIVAGDNGPVSGANVELMLTWDGGRNWDLNGYTDSEGKIKFRLTKAPKGNYIAIMANLTCEGYTWEKTQGVLSASYSLTENSKGKPRRKDR
jgi:hypothetical protein